MNHKNKIIQKALSFLQNAVSPTILGGHFALINNPDDTQALLPGIFQDCINEKTSEWIRKHPYMSYFPSETFSFSSELLRGCEKSKLLLLVNDWQHVEDTVLLKASLRQSFYAENKFPRLFLDIAAKYDLNLNEKVLSAPEKNTYHKSFYWSETVLRRKFEGNARYKSCSLKHGCAQEFLPLLDSCDVLGIDRMVALIPGTCAYPILDAVNEFKRMHNGNMSIMTIFIGDSLFQETFWESHLSVFIDGEE